MVHCIKSWIKFIASLILRLKTNFFFLTRLMFQKKAKGRRYPVHHNMLSKSDKSYFPCPLGSKKVTLKCVIFAEVTVVKSLS